MAPREPPDNAETNCGNPDAMELLGNARSGENCNGEPPASRARAPTVDSPGWTNLPAGWCSTILKTKKPVWAVAAVTSGFWIVIGCILFAALTSRGKPSAATPPSCPSRWVGYEGTCYDFSEAEADWDSSQRDCLAYGASLATIRTQEEWDFIMRFKRGDHWFGARRENSSQPWRWTNGLLFNSSLFQIGANGECAYLNDEKASSTWCHTPRNWICSKSLSPL